MVVKYQYHISVYNEYDMSIKIHIHKCQMFTCSIKYLLCISQIIGQILFWNWLIYSFLQQQVLTHYGLVMPYDMTQFVIVGSGNSLSLVQCQTIIWINAE